MPNPGYSEVFWTLLATRFAAAHTASSALEFKNKNIPKKLNTLTAKFPGPKLNEPNAV